VEQKRAGSKAEDYDRIICAAWRRVIRWRKTPTRGQRAIGLVL
jgi:hypothetical protein